MHPPLICSPETVENVKIRILLQKGLHKLIVLLPYMLIIITLIRYLEMVEFFGKK